MTLGLWQPAAFWWFSFSLYSRAGHIVLFYALLGIMQDIFSRIGGRLKRNSGGMGYKKPHTVLKYSILAVTLVVTMVWGFYMITLLDPYSIFGRFMTFFAKPVCYSRQ